MKKFFVLKFTAALFFILPLVSFAQISKIVFTTDPQSIKPGEISLPITIQAQNSSGSPEDTPETIDLEFFSTSQTGEFLGASGNATTKTMSKNTANRTFYYRDSTSGSFTIKVNAKGRESLKEWSISQPITISSSATAPAPSNSSQSKSSLNESSNTVYSYSSAANSSQTPIASSFEIYAGGDRLTSAGSPIVFNALVKKTSSGGHKTDFSWSFGDGSVGGGEEVAHTYKYPGTYVVVLNGRSGILTSLSRLKVEVIKPEIILSKGVEFVEIKNNSDKEINLFNWKIKDEKRGFIFQPDTIILPNSSIQLDNSILNLNLSYPNIILEDSIGREVTNSIDKTEQDLKKIEEEAILLQDQIAVLAENEEVETLPEIEEKKSKDFSQAASVVLGKSSSSTEILFETSKNKGFFTKLTDFIKRVLFN